MRRRKEKRRAVKHLTKFDLDDDRGEEEEERGKRGCILLTAMH